MRNRGIETWREHCDSIECYQTLVLSQTEDISKITQEEYDRVIAYELPEGRKPIKEIQDKLDNIKAQLEKKNNINNTVSKEENKYSSTAVSDKDKHPWENNKTQSSKEYKSYATSQKQ